MLRRIGNITLSVWLAILLLFGSTSREFIHLFAGHKDTIHTHSQKEGLSFENKHHHCSFLDDALPLYVNDFVNPVIHVKEQAYCIYNSRLQQQYTEVATLTAFLRGPPSA
ncbi:MAG: hypothetical protein JST82_14545 [Bacteroidetes bacterium]|nr:hypothetical protein [Bacteroidota bacterium]